ncbi:hypothetical protein FHG87_023918 [Trinorchestia longiramus]|nr:hypothetical protein FHG87_023918 [Trinorchestia longiramus]
MRTITLAQPHVPSRWDSHTYLHAGTAMRTITLGQRHVPSGWDSHAYLHAGTATRTFTLGQPRVPSRWESWDVRASTVVVVLPLSASYTEECCRMDVPQPTPSNTSSCQVKLDFSKVSGCFEFMVTKKKGIVRAEAGAARETLSRELSSVRAECGVLKVKLEAEVATLEAEKKRNEALHSQVAELEAKKGGGNAGGGGNNGGYSRQSSPTPSLSRLSVSGSINSFMAGPYSVTFL